MKYTYVRENYIYLCNEKCVLRGYFKNNAMYLSEFLLDFLENKHILCI